MSHERDDALRVLLPRDAARRLSRRGFLGTLGATLGGTLGAGALLAACGTRDDAAAGGSGSATTAAGAARGTAAAIEGSLNVYTWAEYHDPANQQAFTRQRGPAVKVDVFDSNEAMLAKLQLAGATAGYDVVVPSGPYVPQMIAAGLLIPLDRSMLPNLANLDPAYVDQPWDRGNRYTVAKNWGATGYVYDRRVIREAPRDWAAFFRAAAMRGVTGRVSVSSTPADLAGMVFWRDGIDWRTEKPEHLDHAERVLLAELAPHVRAFDSFPGPGMLEGSYVLSQAFNGDARGVIVEDPDRYGWVLGAPRTELWVDHWAILASARHPQAAHAWIDFMLDPAVAARETAFHGYATAVQGTRERLPVSVALPDMIYLSESERGRLVPGEVNSAQDRLVAIYNKVKARAGA